MKLELSDLVPRACTIEIFVNSQPKHYSLRKMSLLVMIWIKREWGSEEKWASALDPESEVNKKSGGIAHIEALCKTIHHLIEEKADFPTWENFAEAVGMGEREMLNLTKALLTVQGVSMPDVDRIGDDAVKTAKKKAETMSRKGRAGKK